MVTRSTSTTRVLYEEILFVRQNFGKFEVLVKESVRALDFRELIKKERKPVPLRSFFRSVRATRAVCVACAVCVWSAPMRMRPSSGAHYLLAPAIPNSLLLFLSWTLSLLQAPDGRFISREHTLPLQGFSGQNCCKSVMYTRVHSCVRVVSFSRVLKSRARGGGGLLYKIHGLIVVPFRG